MNDQRSYGMLNPGASRLKRKGNESLYPAKRPPPPPPPPRSTVTSSTIMITTSKGSKGAEMTSPNKLLAGYMAYEFLTKGTLLGQNIDAEKAFAAARGKNVPETELKKSVNGNENYKEITSLLMMSSGNGVHIPGIVNPSQLTRWIQM